MKEERKILSEEQVTAESSGKIVWGVQRILQGSKGTFRQEVVYLGRTLGDPKSYSLDENEKMLQGAKILLSELAGQKPKG